MIAIVLFAICVLLLLAHFREIKRTHASKD